MTSAQNDVDGPRKGGKSKEATMADEAVNKLEIAFAEFKGTVSSDLRNLSNDVKSLTMVFENFVPRREIERETRATDERLKRLEENKATDDRLNKLEGWQTFMNKQAWGQWLAGSILGGTVLKKLF